MQENLIKPLRQSTIRLLSPGYIPVVTETEGGTGSGTSSTFTTDAEQKDETVPHTEAVLSETSYLQ